MSITIKHVAGYSSVDHVGQEIIKRAIAINGGEKFDSIKNARKCVDAAVRDLPESLRKQGLPRVDALRSGSTHAVARIA
jgi:hypothetical protein